MSFFAIENQWQFEEIRLHKQDTIFSLTILVLKMCPIFFGSVDDFGRFDDDLIQRRNTYFHYVHMWFQKSQKNLEWYLNTTRHYILRYLKTLQTKFVCPLVALWINSSSWPQPSRSQTTLLWSGLANLIQWFAI